MSDKSENVILMGGGLDSYITLLWMIEHNIENITPLFVDYHQIATTEERVAVIEQCKKHDLFSSMCLITDGWIINNLNDNKGLLFSKNDKNPVLYGRNLFLSIIAASIGNNIWLGLDKPMDNKEPFFDCTLSYFEMVKLVIGNPAITFHAPFVNTDKIEAVQYGLDRDPDLFDTAFSCWMPNRYGKQCGNCDKCLKTKRLRGITEEMLGG